MAKIILVGGYAPFLLAFRGPLLHALAQQGHKVTACAPEITDKIKESINNLGVSCQSVPICRTGLNPFKDFKTIVALRRIFIQEQPDIILNYNIKPVIYGSLAAKFASVPQCYSMISGLGYSFSVESKKDYVVHKIICLLYKNTLKFNQNIFFQNPDDRDLFLCLNLIREEQAVLINGSGVDLDHYQVAPLPHKISFLLVARLISEKGILEYVEAARLIHKKYPQTRFILVGWGYDSPSAIDSKTLKKLAHEGLIDFRGKMEDVRPAYTESSVFVLPSYYREGVPKTILEAMAMGRPIITTDSVGCREPVTQGVNGFLVPPKDSIALSQEMEKFILRPKLIQEMGAASRKIADEKYDAHKINNVIFHTMDLV